VRLRVRANSGVEVTVGQRFGSAHGFESGFQGRPERAAIFTRGLHQPALRIPGNRALGRLSAPRQYPPAEQAHGDPNEMN
jgi:hypothetical protein